MLMRTLTPLLLLACLVGCSDDETTPPTASICDEFETPYDPYVAGLTKTGDSGVVRVELVEATPAPPAKGDNAWMVRILDSSGSPLPDATVTEVQPFMPEHGHGTSVIPAIGPTSGDGMVEVSAIDFRMAGVWTVTVEVETAAGETDRAVFGVCIDG